MNEVVNVCTPGVTAAMVSRHLGTWRAACRALQMRHAMGGPPKRFEPSASSRLKDL
jgi:hypothetical protein